MNEERYFSNPIDIRGRPLLPIEDYISDLGIFYGVASGIVLTNDEMERRTRGLAKDICDMYDEGLVIGCIMNGGFHFLGKLEEYFEEFGIDILDVLKVQTKSYGMKTVSSGKVDIIVTNPNDIPTRLKGRDVLIVEDMIDSRRTMYAVSDFLREYNPRSLRAVVAFDKPSRAEVILQDNLEIGIGHIIDDHYVFGYGLDAWDFESTREVPHLVALDPSFYDAEKGLVEVCDREKIGRIIEEEGLKLDEIKAYLLLLEIEKEKRKKLLGCGT